VRLAARRLVVAIVLCLFGYGAAASADEKSHAAKAFVQHVRAYVRLDATARAAYRHGDIFTPDVVDEFRKMIRKAFDGKDGRNMRRTIRESDPIRPTTLRVNDFYPEDIPLTTMPPTLLRSLPALPPEMAYRIISGALVLQEINTNEIVDFMSDAIPRLK
jgi:hypothetical protein